MAKKVAGKKSSTKRQPRRSDRDMGMEEATTINRFQNRFTEQKDLKEMLRELASNPTVRYVAGGIATALLARVATNLSDRYPEISNFIKENVENFEDRLNDFKGSGQAHH